MAQDLIDDDETFRNESKMYSYDITQKLTYFVITVELALCGFMLLNKDKLSTLKYSEYLFLTLGLAAFIGILWRFAYNITFHSHAHYKSKGDLTPDNPHFNNKRYKVARFLQSYFHDIYVLLTLASFGWILVAGYRYLACQI